VTLTLPKPSSLALPRFATDRDLSRQTYGGQVAEVSQALGFPLMPWQQMVADIALEINPTTGLLQYRTIVLTVPRQSGKTQLVLALVMHRALMMGQKQRITYTAQSRNDARKKWEDDWLPTLEGSIFASQFRTRKTNGNEALIFRNTGSMQDLLATTKKSGHGKSLDLAIADEAFAQIDNRLEQAFRPPMITREQPQMWIISTAGDDSSVWLREHIERGRQAVSQGHTDTLAFFEWSAHEDADPFDPQTWRDCMPALGHTVDESTIKAELEAMDLNDFRRAYLNQWVSGKAHNPIVNQHEWDALKDTSSSIGGVVQFAVDMTPSRDRIDIGVAGWRPDNLAHVELVDTFTNSTDAIERIVQLTTQYNSTLVLDPGGPVGSMVPELQERGVRLVLMKMRDQVAATGRLHDAIIQQDLRHIGQADLTNALMAAKKRPLGDAYALARTDPAVPISPIVAVSEALWGLTATEKEPTYDIRQSIF
jgi:hypothetical protein